MLRRERGEERRREEQLITTNLRTTFRMECVRKGTFPSTKKDISL